MPDPLEGYLFVHGGVQETDVVTVNDFRGHSQTRKEASDFVHCSNARSVNKVLSVGINTLLRGGQDYQRVRCLYPGIEQVIETRNNEERKAQL